MALSTLNLAVGHLLPVIGDEHRVRRPVLIPTSNRAVPTQVKSENDHKPQSLKALNSTRRDVLLSLTAASLAGVTFFSSEHVEARTVKSENRKRVMEKLKKLREKAGGSKSKTGEAEKEPLSQPTSPLSLYPQKNSNALLVEAALEKIQ